MAIKSPKNKGSAGEREAAAILKLWADQVGIEIDPTRNLEQVRGGGYDLNGVVNLGIEIKRVESNGINQWWKQCVRQADADGTIPFLMHRKNRQPWRFRIRTSVAMENMGKWAWVLLNVDLEASEAKLWFQEHVKLYQGEENEKI